MVRVPVCERRADGQLLNCSLHGGRSGLFALGDWLVTSLATLEPRGHPGIATRSKLIRLRRAGLDDSRRQYVINDTAGHRVLRADFAWPAHRIALHTDSTIWHSQQERMTRDAEQAQRMRC